jgi:diguanylate cyclase (GGDEF)-like protein
MKRRKSHGRPGGAITARLASWPQPTLVLVGSASFIALTLIRFFTPPGLYFAVLYLIPISFFTWFIGLRSGIATACGSVVALLSFDLLHGIRAHPYWDTAMNLGMFIFMVFILAEVRALYERERNLSRTDVLTGLLNRRAFVEMLERERTRHARFPRPITLAYLDVDNFKKVNDTYGHAAGDELLITSGETMEETVRTIDSVGRLGGDEFALLLPETDADAAKLAIEKVQRRLREAVQGRSTRPATFSIGVVTFDTVPNSAEEMLTAADSVMYSVKQSGKDRSQFQRFAA